MEFETANKTFVKSKNSVKNIYLNYTYSLIGLIILMCLFYLIFGYKNLIIPLLSTLCLSFIISSVVGYIINLINNDKRFMDIYLKDNIHLVGLIIGLTCVNTDILVLFIAILVSLLIKKYYKGINLSAALYGILFILLYKYFTNDLFTSLNNIHSYGLFSDFLNNEIDVKSYLIGVDYISPFLAIIAFLYLFHRKSIKYNVFVSYLLTFSFIMFIYGIFNEMSFGFMLFEMACNNIIFLGVYTLCDYSITPTLAEGQILYGVLLGVISSILRFVIPEFAVVTPLIIGPLLFTRIFENIGPKLKYNKKFYNLLFVLSIILIIITIISLSVVF